MTWLISIIIFILGLLVFTFTISNIILILFFAIPTTKKIKMLFDNHKVVIKSYIVTLIIQILIIVLITFIFYKFFTDTYFISLIAGYIFAFFGILFGFNKFKLNDDNLIDYFNFNKKHFQKELIEKYDDDKENVLENLKNVINKK